MKDTDTHTQWHGISHLQIKQSHKHQISCGNCGANKRLDKPKTRTSMKTKRKMNRNSLKCCIQ